MSTLENRIEEMQKKASAKSAELQAMATATDISDKKKERLENRAEKVEERADKREGVARSNAEWWEWIKGGMNSAPATTPQSDTTNQPQTTTPQTTTTTPPQTEAEGGATPQTTTTAPTTEPKSAVEEILGKAVANTQDANKRKAEALSALQTVISNNQSAYQQLVKDALKRKDETAKKQERNARSQAIANALGSLVNVITAGAIAKRNGNIPIVAEYDDTADSALRKSIEQRYALGNENENLLMKLEQERMKHEADLAKQNYDQEVGAIEAETRAKNDILGKLAEGELYKERVGYRVNAEAEKQKGVHDHKVDNPTPPKNNGGKPKLSREEIEIANRVNNGRTKRSGGKSSRTPYVIREADQIAISNEYNRAKALGLKNVDEWVKVYNELWIDDDMRNWVGNKEVRTIVVKAISRGVNASDIVASLKEKFGINDDEAIKK